MKNLEDLVGFECIYKIHNEHDEYVDDLKCEVVNLFIEIEEGFGTLNISIGVYPIGEHNLSEEELIDMQMGVPLDSLYGFVKK